MEVIKAEILQSGKSRKEKRIEGLITASASLVSGFVYFFYVRPLHAEFADRMDNGRFFYYFYLFYVGLIVLSGVGGGLYTIYRNPDDKPL